MNVKIPRAASSCETLYEAFVQSCETYPQHPFIAVPASPGRNYYPEGFEQTYADCRDMVEALIARYREAGFGNGHRVALCLDNWPEHIHHKFALAAIGASLVPLNPQYRPAEAAYVIDHCASDLVVGHQYNREWLNACIAAAANNPPLYIEATETNEIPSPRRPPPQSGALDASTEVALLYTSGTTGRPKGCILSNEYELACAKWYVTRGGLLTYQRGAERLFNPLPLYHINAGLVSLVGMMLVGGCQIQPDRFHPRSWWADIVSTRATIIHYLGVVAPMLLNQPESPLERQHNVKVGVGAGIEPTLHEAFEQRFGIPMVELWGMTEAVRVLADCHEPRDLGTRAFGRAVDTLEARVVDDNDHDVPTGEPGELVIRYSAETPRKHFFSGYLNDAEATEKAWRGGWFHTGDTVRQDETGMLHFVDRKKNIIRRSGENIAAAEIEAVLQAHPDVEQIAVLAVADEVREEEVMACVVLRDEQTGTADKARQLFDFAFERLAYYKPPGWLLFVSSLPTTGTQKIQKHLLFGEGDPREQVGIFDFRDLKRR